MTKIIKKRNNNPTNAASIFKFNSADNADTFAEEIFNTVRELLLLLDEEFRVVKANRSFYDFFEETPDRTIGRLIYELGNQQWNIPQLKELLETILPGKTTIDNFKVEHDFPGIGKRILLLNARQIERALENANIILLDIMDVTVRMQTEKVLNESEERFRSLFESSTIGIYRTTHDGQILLANPTLVKMLGYSSFEKLAARNLEKDGFEPTYERKQFLDKLEKYDEVKGLEATWNRTDGSVIYIRESAKAIRDSNGKTLYYDGTVEDITERKQAEKALLKSENELQVILESTADGILATNNKGKVIKTNKRFAELWRIPKSLLDTEDDDALQNYVLAQLVNPEEFLLKVQLLYESTEEGRDILYFKDGRIFERYSAPFTIDDSSMGRVWSFRDITERMRDKEALHKSNKKYYGIFENIQDVYFETSIDGTILEVSPSMEIISKGQYRRDDLIGKSMYEIYSDASERDSLISKLRQKGSVSEYEVTFKNRDGSLIPCSVLAKLFFDDKGQPEKIVGSMRDITERKQTEGALRQSEARLTDAMKIAKLSTWEYYYALDRFTFDDQFYSLFHTTVKHEGGYTMSFLHFAQRFVYPDDQIMLKKEMQKALVTSDPTYSSHLEYRVIYTNGEIGYFTSNILIEKDADNRTIKAYGVNQDFTERKRMEAVLLRINKAVESSGEAICMSDPHGYHFYHNKAFTDLFGYTVEEVDAAGGGSAIYTDKNVARKVFDTIMAGGLWRGEVDMLSRSGRILVVLLRADAIKDANGEIVGLVGMHTDITERKRADDALHESEEKYRNLIDNMNDGIFISDEKGIIKFANNALAHIHGYDSPDKLLNRAFIEFVEPSARNEIEELFKNEIHSGDSLKEIEMSIINHNGTIVNVLVKPSIILDGKRIVGMSGIVHDITERKLANEALRLSELRFKQVSENAREWIWEVDEKGLFTYVSPVVKEILGYDPEEIICKKHFYDFFGQKEEENVKQLSFELFAKKESFKDLVSINRHKDGREIILSTSGVPIVDNNKNLLGYRGLNVNITDRKLAEKEIKEINRNLVELNKTKDKLFSIIAHDLRNPFITILGFSDILLTEFGDLTEEEKITYIEEMKKSAEISYALLQNLLQWSRSQTGHIEFAPQQIDLLKIIQDNIKLIEKSAETKEIGISYIVPETINTILADEDMLNSIIRNLLTNALKFTAKGGKIEITAAEQNGLVEICVSDNGIGMNEEVMENLFRIDVTHSTVGTNNEAGTGLGLILCKDFVEKHGGKIWVESKKNIGTTFSFTLSGENTHEI